MVKLRENEAKTLLALKEANGRLSVSEISKRKDLAHAAVMRAALSLESDGLIRIIERKIHRASLTDEGRTYADVGLPERRLVEALSRLGGEASLSEALSEASLKGNISAIALGWFSRKGWGRIEKKKRLIKLLRKPSEGMDERLLRILRDKEEIIIEDLGEEMREAIRLLRGRKLVETHEETQRELELTEKGWRVISEGIEISREISQITPELIISGKWREARLRKYDIKAPVAPVWPGKKHPYLRFLDELKQRLVSLGFKEMTGPIVELSFFNCDALYMPQDHPAREVHDMYFIKDPKYGKLDRYKRFLENVRRTHENGWVTGSKGWRYSFSLLEATRLMLRSQTTAASARMLISEKLEIPGKYFAIARCFRPDVIDKTHLTEFNQVEGIVLGEDLGLKDLLGILKRFAIDVAGADRVKYRPDYFPFTEPSVELIAYKEGYGWMEFGGSGIFRPEVTLPLGIKVPVLAWGLGVDRLFMMKMGIDDIRYLFSYDLDWIRRAGVT
ncbi:phenylalanine--tRNA ligase subunit alpha [Candidatus Bathyarchaeota archaeon]|nr:phenylalanine--tRNA ligase subunit alpha [Candidatus Bathyarchaeota archaeon]